MKKNNNKKQIDAEINRVLLNDFDKIETFIISKWKQLFIGAGVIVVLVAIGYGIMLKKENNERAAQRVIADAATKEQLVDAIKRCSSYKEVDYARIRLAKIYADVQLTHKNTGGIKRLFPGNTDQLIVFFQFIDNIIERTDFIRLQYGKVPYREEGKAIAESVSFSVAGGKSMQVFNMMLNGFFRKIYPDISIVGIVEISDFLHPFANLFNIAFRNQSHKNRIPFCFGELFVKQYGTQK